MSAFLLYHAKDMPDSATMWSSLNAICVTLSTKFAATVSVDIQKVVIVELVKAMSPCRSSTAEPHQIIVNNTSHMKKICKWMQCPMEGSTLYSIRPEKKKLTKRDPTVPNASPGPIDEVEQAEQAELDEQVEPPAKKIKGRRDISAKAAKAAAGPTFDGATAKKLAPKRSAKSTAQAVASHEPPRPSLVTCVPGRSKQWLECFASGLVSAAAGFNIQNHYTNKESHDMTVKCFDFLIRANMQLSTGRKPTSRWSVAKPAAVAACVTARRKSLPEDDQELVVALSATTPTDTDEDGARYWAHILASFLEQPTEIARLHNFLEEFDPSLPSALCPMYADAQKAMTKVMLTFRKQKLDITYARLLEAAHDFISLSLKDGFVLVARAAVAHPTAGAGQQLASDADIFFEDSAQCIDFVQMRTKLVVYLLEIFADRKMKAYAISDFESTDVATIKDEAVFASITGVDALLAAGRQEWVDAWKQILVRARDLRAGRGLCSR